MSKEGRNGSCSCGSGKKYKQCCLNKEDNAERKNEEFSMSEEEFKTKYLPIYTSKGSNPFTLVQFSIVLPYEVPFKEDICCTMINQDGSAISLKFTDIEVDDGYKYGVSKGENFAKVNFSRVEMTYASIESFEEIKRDTEKFLNEYFDLLLDNLNILILSYQISKKDTDVYFITKEMLAICLVARIVKVDDWSKLEHFMFMVHENMSYIKEKITMQESQEIIRHCGLIISGVNPFIVSENFILNAKRFFKNGFYQEAVIYTQTGIETFIKALLVEFLNDEKASESEIDKKLETTSFINIIKKEIASRIGGTWDITRQDTEVGKWHVDTYMLRNRIVHTGYRPRFNEVEQAICSAIEVREYIIKLIEIKKVKYKLLNSYFFVREV